PLIRRRRFGVEEIESDMLCDSRREIEVDCKCLLRRDYQIELGEAASLIFDDLVIRSRKAAHGLLIDAVFQPLRYEESVLDNRALEMDSRREIGESEESPVSYAGFGE